MPERSTLLTRHIVTFFLLIQNDRNDIVFQHSAYYCLALNLSESFKTILHCLINTPDSNIDVHPLPLCANSSPDW